MMEFFSVKSILRNLQKIREIVEKKGKATFRVNCNKRINYLLTWTSFCFSELTCRFEGLMPFMFAVSDRFPLDFDLMAFVANGP